MFSDSQPHVFCPPHIPGMKRVITACTENIQAGLGNILVLKNLHSLRRIAVAFPFCGVHHRHFRPAFPDNHQPCCQNPESAGQAGLHPGRSYTSCMPCPADPYSRYGLIGSVPVRHGSGIMLAVTSPGTAVPAGPRAAGAPRSISLPLPNIRARRRTRRLKTGMPTPPGPQTSRYWGIGGPRTWGRWTP